MNSIKPIYLAPLQGYTNVFYRRALNEVYSVVDKYFTPFFEEEKDSFSDPQLLPELDQVINAGCVLVPQVASNNSKFLIDFTQKVSKLGFDEVNINMGCPFPMLVKRQKGGGMLSEPYLVEQLLSDFFSKDLHVRLSIKMRAGLNHSDQGLEILQVLNKFPIHEIIIHPRLVTQKYNGQPNWIDFERMFDNTHIPLVANGDLITNDDIQDIYNRFPDIKAVMLGRGMLRDPSIINLLDEKQKGERFRLFHQVYFDLVMKNALNWNQAFNYFNDFWFYPLSSSTEGKRHFRKLKKYNNIESYKDWINPAFDLI
ncbi:tRNA-dihydrouridine synthase family protein [Carboxylicivirga caseinilyticus]|uniref:tRNA-dihydrouridine synthase family protein n=1 Tax=Carboxylicivirga caseinilyticus TaxID=3417572 RepID=UPI003D32955E|nr:tRNA-dihydrouridine synthase family protein [Marinilabiliaceae bacterium A049]